MPNCTLFNSVRMAHCPSSHAVYYGVYYGLRPHTDKKYSGGYQTQGEAASNRKKKNAKTTT